ncbi:hypothetical protein [Streptomyces agglomeratus]|uniref:hypothetical protein n=1 Tax=Streptomyces agglomeratus TaxID=285458 RepID=UPI00114D3BEE|nr:hypothetical protein [Streptomyces agglomeratus]
MTTEHARKSAVGDHARTTGSNFLRAAHAPTGLSEGQAQRTTPAGQQFAPLADTLGRFAGVVSNRRWLVDARQALEGWGLARGLTPIEAPAHSQEVFVEAQLNQQVPQPRTGTVPALSGYQHARVMPLVAARRDSSPGYLRALRRGRQAVLPTLEAINEVAAHVARGLHEAGLAERVVAISSRDGRLSERKRIGFQHVEALVVVLNALEGINLYAGERNAEGGGRDATATPRVCLIAHVLTGGRTALQAEGRTQRDERSAPVLYTCEAGTEEAERTAATFRSLSNTPSPNMNDRADQITPQDTA